MEYTFKIKTGKNGKTYERKHFCKDGYDARQQLYGMVYAMFFTHKHPTAELWCEGRMVHKIQ